MEAVGNTHIKLLFWSATSSFTSGKKKDIWEPKQPDSLLNSCSYAFISLVVMCKWGKWSWPFSYFNNSVHIANLVIHTIRTSEIKYYFSPQGNCSGHGSKQATLLMKDGTVSVGPVLEVGTMQFRSGFFFFFLQKNIYLPRLQGGGYQLATKSTKVV